MFPHLRFPYSQSQVKTFLSRLFGRVRCQVEGLEHLPAEGPAILVMNHTGWEEILLTILAIPRPLKIVGMRELMFLDEAASRARLFATAYAQNFGPVRRGLTTLSGKLLGKALRRQMLEFGFIPARVFTETWPPVLGSNGVRDTLRALKAGQVVLIFPEGGYKRDGVMRPFKPGIGLLLRLLERCRLQVPILPAAQRTADSISLSLNNRYLPRIVFGSPLRLTAGGPSPRAFDRIAARLLQDQVYALFPRVWPDPPPQTYLLASSDPPPVDLHFHNGISP